MSSFRQSGHIFAAVVTHSYPSSVAEYYLLYLLRFMAIIVHHEYSIHTYIRNIN